jgi:hypothetical protein
MIAQFIQRPGADMDQSSQAIALCINGTQAEYAGRPDTAHALYQQAWDTAADDYERCIAAHYLARFQATPEETLHWNEVALALAEGVGDDRVTPFFPSLYVNLGQSHEQLGHKAEAQRFYQLAADLGLIHNPGQV